MCRITVTEADYTGPCCCHSWHAVCWFFCRSFSRSRSREKKRSISRSLSRFCYGIFDSRYYQCILTHSAPGLKLYKGGSTKHGNNEWISRGVPVRPAVHWRCYIHRTC